MIDRSLQQRVRKIDKLLAKAEQLVSVERKKREEYLAQVEERMRPEAQLHATAVAAIVMFGKPEINEPLIRAWERTLRHLGITLRNEYGRECEYQYPYDPGDKSEDDDVAVSAEIYDDACIKASRELYPVIIKGANEIKKFTEIFRTAPVWLLEFTFMRRDAYLLKFGLPRMSDKQIWGERGFKDFLRWPQLPWGRMTDGNRLPAVDLPTGVPPDMEEEFRQRLRLKDYLGS